VLRNRRRENPGGGFAFAIQRIHLSQNYVYHDPYTRQAFLPHTQVRQGRRRADR
jgi:hypothetical protein